jgi:DNA polymerase delta subunit 2
VPDEACSIVGVIFKELASRPNLLKQYREIGVDSQAVDLSTSEGDSLFLEDATGRIQLVDVDPIGLPTGVVLGVFGELERSKSKFRVIETYEPLASPVPSPPPRSHTVAFVGGLAVDSRSFDWQAAKCLIEAINECAVCVVFGNNFDAAPESHPDEMLSFQARIKEHKWPVGVLEGCLGLAKCSIVLMPGENDPCARRLPQRPYHQCMFARRKWKLVTNPVQFAFDGTAFLCGAGESPRDIAKVTALSFHDAQRSIIRWRHYAPTAPDDIPCTPLDTRDILVIQDLPNVFVCGSADHFAQSEVNGVSVISVPAFAETKSAVFYDMGSRQATLRNFAALQ